MGDEVVQGEVAELESLAQRFAACGDGLFGVAGGVDRAMPPVPGDEHDLARRFIEFDEARERLDRRAGDELAALSRRLREVAAAVVQADTAPFGAVPGT